MKTKRILSLLASLAMIVTALTGAISVSASEVANGTCGDLTWTLDSDGVLTLSGEGEMASPKITGSIVQGDFLDIYEYKDHMNEIREVVIEEGVTLIGYCAFYHFPNLVTVSIPSTVTTFPYTSNNSKENRAFDSCTSLKNIKLADGLTCIGDKAFYGCTSLESIVIPSTITYFGDHAFSDCTSLKNITLTEGLKVLGGAFNNTAVENVYLPSSIETWNATSAYDRGGISGPFRNCTKLKSVTFGDGIKEINVTAFEGCYSLEELSFGDNSQLTKIERAAFNNCTGLKRIEIPESVTTLEATCFSLCSSVQTVYLYSRTLDTYNLPDNAMIFAYPDSAASGQKSCINIETAITGALNDLKTAVKEAEKYSEEDYTTASYGVLKALLNEAATKDDESHILGMRSLTEEIYAAIDGLVDKSEEPSSSDPSSDPSDSSNPTDNSSDPSNSSDNNNQSQSPNTPATPPTAAPTTATPKPVTPPTVTTTVAKPAKVKAVKVKAKRKKLNVSWKKVSGATGYEVLSATNNKFTKNKMTVTVKKNKVTLKKLKPKKKYFVKVRAYKLANGRKYFGKWSKVVKKKVR